MKKRMAIKLYISIILVTLLASLLIFQYFQKKDSTINLTQIANPASKYCTEQNGTLEIRNDKLGNQYGVCIKNGTECEEWKFFRGECEDKSNLTSASECQNDKDCVPASCCHPTSCISKQNAPNCKGIMCTMVCLPNSLDCEQGSCVCVNNKCSAMLK